MAKETKGGLGRGLSSLLGTNAKEAPKTSAASERVRVSIDDADDEIYSVYDAYSPTSSVGSSFAGTATFERQDDVADEAETVQSTRQSFTASFTASGGFGEIPVNSVEPNPDQPRTNFDKEEIEELAASIAKDGLLQPIMVRPVGQGKYQIIAGERRWQACKAAKLDKVPAVIKEADDDKALELALVENVQRVDLNPIEEAYGYKRLMDRRQMTQADIAQTMSKGRSTVANALRLLELPEEAQQLLFEDKITAGHARAILSIPTKKGRQALTDKLMSTKLSVRETEALARQLSGKQESQAAQREPEPETFKTVAKALHDVLGTKVSVKSSNGKNKIEIEFKDEEELKRLFEELLASVS